MPDDDEELNGVEPDPEELARIGKEFETALAGGYAEFVSSVLLGETYQGLRDRAWKELRLLRAETGRLSAKKKLSPHALGERIYAEIAYWGLIHNLDENLAWVRENPGFRAPEGHIPSRHAVEDQIFLGIVNEKNNPQRTGRKPRMGGLPVPNVEIEVKDPDVRRAVEVVFAAIGGQKLLLEDRGDELEAALAESDPPSEPAVKGAWLQIHATIDYERLQLDEGQEAELVRELQRLRLYRLPGD
ncbi:MAG TPA: hypothetical protein VK335_00800 [Bryobacteraceae bacterium]|nr:hypothetical protein [Bryobacteraceae bacterium]HZW92041.1 hypothetical protein [Candidatus Eremiobacteraceae bacterium]